jgi:hypothetical protein
MHRRTGLASHAGPAPHFTPAQMLETQRSFLRRFDLRPGFVVRQLAGVRSEAHLSALV